MIIIMPLMPLRRTDI